MKQVPILLFLLFLYGCNDKKQEKLESIIELESEHLAEINTKKMHKCSLSAKC